MFWNVRTLKENRIADLGRIINLYKIDIAAISETKLSEEYNCEAPGFNVYRKDKSSSSGGVALMVRSKIKHEELKISELEDIDAVAIKLYFDNAQDYVVVVAIYAHQNKLAKMIDDLKNLIDLHEKVIVMGDFNAHNISWKCSANNTAGNKLLTFKEEHNLNIYFPEHPTHYPAVRNSNTSTIDILLTQEVFSLKPNSRYALCGVTNLIVIPIILSSDHLPVLFQYGKNYVAKENLFENRSYCSENIFVEFLQKNGLKRTKELLKEKGFLFLEASWQQYLKKYEKSKVDEWKIEKREE